MAGGACKSGVGSVVHRRKSDRSRTDPAVLCAGASFSWTRPAQQSNKSWVSQRDLVESSILSVCFREFICDSEVRANRACPSKPPDKNQSITCKS